MASSPRKLLAPVRIKRTSPSTSISSQPSSSPSMSISSSVVNAALASASSLSSCNLAAWAKHESTWALMTSSSPCTTWEHTGQSLPGDPSPSTPRASEERRDACSSSAAPSSRRDAFRAFLRRLMKRIVFSAADREEAASVAHADRGLIALRAFTADRRVEGAELGLMSHGVHVRHGCKITSTYSHPISTSCVTSAIVSVEPMCRTIL